MNEYFRSVVGDEFSVKDLRTWHGTVLAAIEFSEMTTPENRTQIAKATSAVMKQVGAALGNTATVARDAYVDPRVVVSYRHGRTIAPALRRAARKKPDAAQNILDKATRQLIQRAVRL
ncbi:topoisomerase IB [Mycobacteroides abscessus]|nr:topoisomerase IB [Mycobacteroides abscessus]